MFLGNSSAQTEWEKYPGNPVIELGPSGAWDDDSISHVSVIFDGTGYKMWYAGDDGQRMRLGLASSPDFLVWTKYHGNPVLDVGPSGTWDDVRALAPCVLYDGFEYKMWYEGNDGSNYRIGYATSTDGIEWTKYSGNPVLDLGSSGTWDDHLISGPSVLVDGSGYQMWFTGSDGSNERIGYATSTDGMVWSKYAENPVLDIGPSGEWDDVNVKHCSVLAEGFEFQMWYAAYDGYSERIGYAVSPDGVVWSKDPGNPVIDMGPAGSWDSRHAAHPSVIYRDSEYALFYNGGASSRTRIGYAISLPDCRDSDGDGSWDEACGGWDCDDSDPEVSSGAEEICGNGVDDDCDGLVDYDDDCPVEFVIEMEPSFDTGILSLDFTLGTEHPCVWTNYAVLIVPTFQFIPLWTVPFPFVFPPIEIPVAFPFPSLGVVGIYSAITSGGTREVYVFEWVDTGLQP